jgi:putative transcriptional regulator
MYIIIYNKYRIIYGAVRMEKKQTLKNDLRRCRFEHNEISQQALANEVGVTRLTIHSIEKGKFNPSVLLALKIASFFKKSVEEIFYLED